MKIRPLIFASFLALCIPAVFFIYCAKKSPTQVDDGDFSGSITGYIYSRLTHAPLKDVLVTINADSAHAGLSDANGKFVIGQVKAGTHELHFMRRDYEDTTGITATTGIFSDISRGLDIYLRIFLTG